MTLHSEWPHPGRSRSRPFRVAGSLPWLVLLLGGCLSVPPDDRLTKEETERPAGTAEGPVDLRVAVGVRVDPLRWAPGPGEGTSFTVPLDWDAFGRDVFGALDRASPFRRMTWIPSGTPAPSEAEFLRSAAARDADILVLLEPRVSRVSYEGRNALLWPNLLLWLLLWFPAALVPDEVFSAEVEVAVRVFDARGGRELENSRVSARNERWLDEFSRGYTPWGTVLAPAGFGEENYLDAAEMVLPPAVLDLKRRILDRFLGELRRSLEDPAFRSRLAPRARKRLALVVGISDYRDAEIPDLRFGRADAEAVHAFLARSRGPSAPGWGSTLLTDGAAARESFATAFDRIRREPLRPEDSVLVYFSGYGIADAARASGPALAFHDSKRSDLERTTVPLAELAAALRDLPAGSVFLILDASFSRAREGKSLGGDPGKAPPAGADLRKVLGVRPAAVAAGGADGPAHEVEALGHGLFTACLLDAWNGEADADGDGRATPDEMKRHLSERVSFLGRMIGLRQKPEILGAEGGASFPEGTEGGKR
jgi:hypothetical protein